ncbi:molybdopterin-dependent oxidoreductase [Microbacterium sediminis]|uniref:Oxidoreductase n=1 Tax=Microbacterium sediminis TaxID=904291 RepID=A0A1B9NDD4_9MICO|nr:molybdopterin-dependent oxidoreductase [Microbacterium sediminis]OCG74607.1 oxidoreductase [Microbacterium sediminis]QBR74900.1 oxidoreductase [Microbacterium sediminis]
MTNADRPGRGAAAWAGVAAALLGVGAGELAAALFAPASRPLAVVGAAVIDLAPTWAKDLAIAWFGTADKVALLVLIGLAVAGIAALAGIAQRARPPWGAAVLAGLGLVGAVAATTRANAGLLSPVPSAIAAVVAAVAVRLLLRPRAGAAAPGLTRRGFLVASVAAAVVGAAAAGFSTVRQATVRSIQAIRDAVTLPNAARTATIPPTAELGVPGLASVVTPNADFYRIDTALVVPEIDPAQWRLRIHGLVEQEIVLGWDELLALPMRESAITLACVSNYVGGDLVGNAVWLGHPIRELLARARPRAGADMVLSTSQDGFTAGTPLEALTDDRDALLAIGMNGEPLPLEHGFPVRMVVPGLYGYVSATKWVVDLEVTRFDRARAYWTGRGWSERGPIKLQSRIDVPRQGDVAAGPLRVAGVAWHPHTGVAAVQVQVDDGPWREADLARAISDDTWVQWTVTVDARPGEHTIRCRAVSADGEVQTAATAPPAPDGATGRHAVRVSAR